MRRLMAAKSGYDDAVWAELAGMGLLGLTIPEEFGGAGAGSAELAVVCEQMGRSLLCAIPVDGGSSLRICLQPLTTPPSAPRFSRGSPREI